jgi:hypothetical protein
VLAVDLIESDGDETLALALVSALVERAAGYADFRVVIFERCRRCGRDFDVDRLRCDWTRASHGLRVAGTARRDDRCIDVCARLLYDDR